ncbi:MAG: Gfo/Idh/MocA family oxidoreductase [Clostridiaceae bacterium]
MKKVRYGILGTARIIDRFVAAVKYSDFGEVSAIASRDLGKARLSAEKLSIGKYYGSYEELYNDQTIDVIYVPTINHMHYTNAKDALLHGKHVVLEKPMTLTQKEAEELFVLAKEKGLFLMEAQKSVFLPVTLETEKLICSGVLGQVHLIDYTISVPNVDFKWFYDKNSGGGALLGSGSYILSHARKLLQEEFVSYDGVATIGETGIDTQCIFNLKSASGVLVSGRITTLVKAESEARIYGEKGMILIKDFWKARTMSIKLYDGEERILDFPVDYEMIYEVNHINDCIRNGLLNSPIMDSETSIATAGIIENLINSF